MAEDKNIPLEKVLEIEDVLVNIWKALENLSPTDMCNYLIGALVAITTHGARAMK